MITQTLFEKKLVLTPPVLKEAITPVLSYSHEKKDLTLEEKQKAFQKAIAFITHRKLDVPQFVSRYGKPIAECAFGELLFVRGYKKTMAEVVFNHDALLNPIVYCLSVSKVETFCKSVTSNVVETRGVIDPWTVFSVPIDVVKEKFHSHRYYEMFMDLVGKEAKI